MYHWVSINTAANYFHLSYSLALFTIINIISGLSRHCQRLPSIGGGMHDFMEGENTKHLIWIFSIFSNAYHSKTLLEALRL